MADKPFDRERGLAEWLQGVDWDRLKGALASLAGGEVHLLDAASSPDTVAHRLPLRLDWEIVGFLECATADEQTLRALADLLELLLKSMARYRMAADLHNEVVESDFAEREYQASHDALTGLPNRNLLADRLTQNIATARRRHQIVAVLFVDLDHFKVVNDSLGHDAGDTLLKEVAARLAGCVREGDTVARQGSDEFVMVVDEMLREEDVRAVTHQVAAALSRPFYIDGQEMFVTCSTGIALYPRDGEDAATLLKHSAIALHRAKETGRNTFQYFAAEMNTRALERLILEGKLRQALERGEFLLYYQPQVDLASGCLIGVEALVRWQHPELGMVSPAQFIPMAEETGLIVPLGEWVLRTACAQMKAWHRDGFSTLRVAVNLSARQFRQQDVVAMVSGVLEETGLDPSGLELELTESLLVQNVEAGIQTLKALSGMGVQLAIDDFGTGYSSLNYLKRFPIDRLKIDQSFVRDITHDPGDAAIVTAIISLSHSLRLKVIAEGVETEAQLAYLRAGQCDEMQGFYFSRPLPVEEMEQLLRDSAAGCLY